MESKKTKKNTKKKIPVTVLTGYLGSGKTTLLNHILTAKHGLKIAVIENEFGAVGIDDQLVTNREFAKEEIVITINGCMCCTVRSDLADVLRRLLIEEKHDFDGIIIETTGLADPAPIAQTFFVEEDILEKCNLDAIITVVDVKHVTQHLDEVRPEGVENETLEQIAFADKLLLSKCDLVDEDHISKVTDRIRSINGSAEIIRVTNGEIDPNLLLNI